MFGRNNDYVVSGPVWEYFRAPKELMFEELPHQDIEDYLITRKALVNNGSRSLKKFCTVRDNELTP